MSSGGPFGFGDVPDDIDPPEDGDSDHRGWIAPEDRLWRHPSEISEISEISGAESGFKASTSSRSVARDLWRERRGAIAAGTLGAAAVAAAAAVVLTLADSPVTVSPTQTLRVAETSLVTLPSMPVSAAPSILQLISTLRPSLVELEPSGDRGRGGTTGVVLPGGDLVVTAASSTEGLSRMVVVTSDGRHLQGDVVASDDTSGISVLRTNGGLVPASFADSDLVPGEVAVTACLRPDAARSAVPTTDVAMSMVQQVGMAAPSSKGTQLMDTIAAETPLRGNSGSVMLDGRGEVIGILGGQESSGADTIGLFVPASLALGVAEELASTHRVEHGWIGVNAIDATGGEGAVVKSVFANSPAAAAGIEAGDLITAIDTHRIRSLADLQGRLYTITPGSVAELTLQRSGATRTVSMDLTPDPGG